MESVALSQEHPQPASPKRRSGGGDSLLKSQAYAILKRRIQEGTYIPGEFLSERQLAAQLGMSKTPIKAALERLESEGLISVSPQQGIVVREFTVHEVADQFEIREALESFVMKSIAGRLTTEQIARVEGNLEACHVAALEGNVPRSVELDAEFHLMFSEFLGNQEIIRVMSQLRDKIHRTIFVVSQRDPLRLMPSYQEHVSIVEAVLAGDAEETVQRLLTHLDYGKQLLLSPRSR